MTLQDDLNQILQEGLATVSSQVTDLIQQAEGDSSDFIRSLGQKLQAYIRQLAGGEIDGEEFKDLAQGLTDLAAMEAARLDVQAKTRAQNLIEQITQIVLNKLLPLLG